MLTSYVDDSGSEGKGPVFVLAGVIARGEQWQRFTEAWERECAREPATPNFHMAQAYSPSWSGWGVGSREERVARRDERIRNLAHIVRNYAVARVHAGLSWAAYRDLAKGRVPGRFDNPYYFLYWKLTLSCVRWQFESGTPEKINFVFDKQSKIGDVAASWYCSAVEAIPEARQILPGSPEFADDSEVIPLKAADILAWHFRKEVAERVERKAQSQTALDILMEIPSIGDANVPAQLLVEIVESINLYESHLHDGC